jgi:hypothetical protein
MADMLNAIARFIDYRIAEALKPLQNELALIKSLQDEWVNTTEAMRITGIRQAQTLKIERERPGTKLVVKFEGKTGRLPRYLRTSLLAHNENKTQSRREGRALVA